MLSLSFLTFSQSEEPYVVGVRHSPPSFKLGETALSDTINKYIKNYSIPDTLSKNARVYVTFRIDSTGNAFDIQLARGYNPYLDSVAMDITKIVTREKWNPGTYPKPTSMTLPFTFKSSQTD